MWIIQRKKRAWHNNDPRQTKLGGMLFNFPQVGHVRLVTFHVFRRMLCTNRPIGNQNKEKQRHTRSFKPHTMPDKLKREDGASRKQERSQIERPKNNRVLTASNHLCRKRHGEAKNQTDENQNWTPDRLSSFVFRPAE